MRIKGLILLFFIWHSVTYAQSPASHKKKQAAKKIQLLKALPGADPHDEKPDTSIKKVPVKKPQQLTRVLFIFDDSQSMLGQWQSGAKIDIAKKMLIDIMDSLRTQENLELALRVYGHQKRFPPQDCEDTRLEVPFAKNNIEAIKEKLSSLTPKGTTPIARSLEACAKDFPATPSKNIVILITDGLEECDADPCKVSQALQKKGIFLKPFIIGIGNNNVDEFKKQFDCIGTYYDGSNEKTFKNIMNVVISQVLNNTTAQINLLDINKKPTETNVAMTLSDQAKGKIKYNFVHTLNNHGNPDTLHIDAQLTYRLVVHTIPPVSKDSIKITPGKHTTIAVEAPQGDLLLGYATKSDYKDLTAIIRKNKEMNTLNIQHFGNTERYLIGKYDIEVLSLPRIYLKDVEVSQSHTTTVKIESPGIVTFMMNGPGFGSLFVEETNKLTWFYNMDKMETRQTLLLQPGNYKIIYRSKASHETMYTIERSFKIESGASQMVYLYQ